MVLVGVRLDYGPSTTGPVCYCLCWAYSDTRTFDAQSLHNRNNAHRTVWRMALLRPTCFMAFRFRLSWCSTGPTLNLRLYTSISDSRRSPSLHAFRSIGSLTWHPNTPYHQQTNGGFPPDGVDVLLAVATDRGRSTKLPWVPGWRSSSTSSGISVVEGNGQAEDSAGCSLLFGALLDRELKSLERLYRVSRQLSGRCCHRLHHSRDYA